MTGPVTHISIVGLKYVSTDTVQAKLALKVGATYTPEAAQTDVAAVQGMGLFHTVNVSAAPAPTDGIVLTYIVSENPVVQSIKFTANTPNGQPSVPSGELISQMRTHIGQVLNTNILATDLNDLFDHSTGYLTNQGYLADVSHDINIDPKTGIITVPLVEYYIKSVEVAGNSRIKTNDILAQTHAKAGDLYDNNALNEVYETGNFSAVNIHWKVAEPGKLALIVSVADQRPATGRLDEKQGKVIPFLYDPLTTPFPVVQVSVNGQLPLPFIVDTGSSDTLSLNLWAAKQLGLKTNGVVEQGNGFVLRRVPIHGIVLQGLHHSDDVFFDTREADVADINFLNRVILGQHVAGSIGLGMLKSVTSRFDFAAKTLTIFATPHPPLHIPGGTVLPLRGSPDNLLTVRATLAPDVYADLIVDTGSDSTQLPLSALNLLHPSALAFNSILMRIDGVYSCPDLRLPNLMLGTLRIPDVVVGTLPPPTRLSLGMNVLAGYRLTMDGPNGQLILEPSAVNKRYVSGWSAMDIDPSGDSWLVDPQSGFPAQRAGLQAGDELVSVNGINVAGLSQPQVEHLIAGVAGVPLLVSAKRGQDKEFFFWVPCDSFSAPHNIVYGISMGKLPSSPWIITEVTKGCPGDLVGLQPEDHIIKINEEVVASMPVDRFEESIKESSLTFQVERPGVAQPFAVRLTAPK